MQKNFDLVIYGATGFTGRLAAQYLMTERCRDLRVAIAGRDEKKLKAIQQSCAIKPEILIADSSQPESIKNMVKQTRVILNFAGPFSLYGEPVVAACAEYGVHYLDITGETPFIHDMIIRYQDAALASGACLIPFSGFDSIPADLTVYLALKTARMPIKALCLYYQIKGGFNGGTLASALYMAEHADKKILRNPNSLILDSSWPRPPSSSSLKPQYEPLLKRWTAPFFMNAINRAVVRRSAWLRKDAHPFQYQERIVMSKRFGYIKAWLTIVMLAGFQFLSNCSFGRNLLKRIGPKPGEGPSKEVCQQGFFRGRLVGRSQNTAPLMISMEREGDPGNEITVALACESALLAVENAFLSQRKGFLTPTTAFGEHLVKRLEKAGFKFKMQ